MKKEIKEKIIDLIKGVEGGCVFFEDKERIATQILELIEEEKQKAIDDCLREHSFKCCQILREAKQKWVGEIEKLYAIPLNGRNATIQKVLEIIKELK